MYSTVTDENESAESTCLERWPEKDRMKEKNEKQEVNEKEKKDPNAPKRAKSSYFIFCDKIRAKLKARSKILTSQLTRKYTM